MKDYLLITTGNAFPSNVAGHVRITAYGLGEDVTSLNMLSVTWALDELPQLTAKAYITGTDTIKKPVYLINDYGKLAFAIPAGVSGFAELSNLCFDGITANDSKVWKRIEEAKVLGFPEKIVITAEYLDESALNGVIPGMVIPYTGEVFPDGFIPYAGQQFDIEAYPELAKLYPTGTMPDFSDDFLRVASADRTVLDHQDQMVGPITFLGKVLPPHTHTLNLATKNSGSTVEGNNIGGPTSIPYGNRGYGGLTKGTITGTGDRTRPANVSVHYITLAG